MYKHRHKTKVFSSYRVHIEGREKCDYDNYEGYDTYDGDDIGNGRKFGDNRRNNFEDRFDDKCQCECGFDVEKGFDGKFDRVIIDVKIDCSLEEQTFYELILAQPVPVDGYNLPVDIRVHYCDSCRGKKAETIRVIRAFEPWGIGDLEYGQDLPTCRNHIPLYFTNGREFVDLRKRCCNL